MHRVAGLLVTLAVAVTAPGCFWFLPRSKGDALERDLNAMRERLERLESTTAEERRRLTEMVGRADSGVADLNRVLKQATGVLTRNSADFGAQVQTLGNQLRDLAGRVEELRNGLAGLERNLGAERLAMQGKLAQLAKRAGVDLPVDASKIPGDRTDHFAAAYRGLTTRDYSSARSLFREYVGRYPRDEQADNAQYWIGQAYLQESRYAPAIAELQKIIDNYPQSEMVDDAMIDMAEGFFRMRSCAEARTLLVEVLRRFPASTLAPRARDKLAEIQRAHDVCGSESVAPAKAPAGPPPAKAPAKAPPRPQKTAL